MIIATIGSTKLKLEKLADAEALLNIATCATLVGSGYDANFHDYKYLAVGSERLSIEIIEGEEIVSYEEHLARQAERAANDEKRRQKQATEAASTAPAA